MLFLFCFLIRSKELSDALGVVANTLPPFIYRMRELGYPPGWLKEAEMENSGLMLYDGKSKLFVFFFLPKKFAESVSVHNGPRLMNLLLNFFSKHQERKTQTALTKMYAMMSQS